MGGGAAHLREEEVSKQVLKMAGAWPDHFKQSPIAEFISKQA